MFQFRKLFSSHIDSILLLHVNVIFFLFMRLIVIRRRPSELRLGTDCAVTKESKSSVTVEKYGGRVLRPAAAFI